MAQINSARIEIGNPDQLKTTFNSLFQQIGVQVDDSFQQAFDSVGKEAVAKLKSTSPKAKGSKKHYASGWTYTKVNVRRGQFSSQIYNKTKPGLAHLLEHKHEIIGPDGESHGWSTPQPHIAQVNDWVQSEIVKRITQNLQK